MLSSVWKTWLKFTQCVPKVTWWAGESLQNLACKVSSSICVTSPAVKPCCFCNLLSELLEGGLHKSISHQGSQVRAGFTEPSVWFLVSPSLCVLGKGSVHSDLTCPGWAGVSICAQSRCWLHSAGPGRARCVHSEPGCPQGRDLQPTQLSCPGWFLPVLPRCKPAASSCPGVNVLIGNKWVFPNSGIKIVQSLWSLLRLRFLMYLESSAGLSLLSCFGFAVFWLLLRGPSLWGVVLLLFQNRTRHSAPKRNAQMHTYSLQWSIRDITIL